MEIFYVIQGYDPEYQDWIEILTDTDPIQHQALAEEILKECKSVNDGFENYRILKVTQTEDIVYYE